MSLLKIWVSFCMQSYLISLFLDCPPGMNLHCPNSSAVAAVESAIRVGTINWHAFPHNAQVIAAMEIWSLNPYGLLLRPQINCYIQKSIGKNPPHV